MKLGTLFCMMLVPVLAAFPAAAGKPVLSVGSEVPLAPLREAKWLKGGAPESFEPGKLYLFECWATWCGACIRAMPHMEELHRKYAPKGLRVYSMNVLEDDADKVAAFVKRKGEGISYPVAFTGKGSAFEREWLNAAGIGGIPNVFVLLDGRLVQVVHPNVIDEALVEALLAGGEKARVAMEALDGELRRDRASGSLKAKFALASRAGDTAGMKDVIATLEKDAPDEGRLPEMRIELLMAEGEWNRALASMCEPGSEWILAGHIAKLGLRDGPEGRPVAFIAGIAAAYRDDLAQADAADPKGPLNWLKLSRVFQLGGNNDEAIAAADRYLGLLRSGVKPLPFGEAVILRYRASLEAGELPPIESLRQWSVKPAKPRPGNGEPASLPEK